ncbi:MAG: N-acetyltransferase family protein [Gemmatimonadota bacterium]
MTDHPTTTPGADTVTVRPATPEDAPRLADFNCRLALESEDRTLDAAMVETGARSILADPARGQYWLGIGDGEPVGCCLVTTEWSDWTAGRYWWLQSVYVEPAWRGRKVFGALWRRVLAAARAAGDVTAIRLYVEAENRDGRAVYERIGMHPTPYLVYELPLEGP